MAGRIVRRCERADGERGAPLGIGERMLYVLLHPSTHTSGLVPSSLRLGEIHALAPVNQHRPTCRSHHDIPWMGVSVEEPIPENHFSQAVQHRTESGARL